MGLIRVDPPDEEPISLELAKLHLRVTWDNEDDLLEHIIRSARETLEDMTNLSIASQTFRYARNGFPTNNKAIFLNRSPLLSVESLTYIDANGDEQELTEDVDYVVDLISRPGRIVPAFGKSWPTARDIANSVTVDFTAGWEDAAAVPGRVKSGMLWLIGHYYGLREPVVTGAISTEIEHGLEAIVTGEGVPARFGDDLKDEIEV